MIDFIQIARLEIKSRLPFPLVDLYFLFFLLLSINNIIGISIESSSVKLVAFRINANQVAHIGWCMLISLNILISAIFSTILVSIAIAGEYENGKMMTQLSLPISRRQYFTTKCVIYGGLSAISLICANIVALFVTSFQLSFLEIITLMMICISSTILFLSIPVFIAVFTNKAVVSILTSLLCVFLFQIILPSLPIPYSYFFDPEQILISNEPFNAFLWGMVFPSLVGISLLLFSLNWFSRIDILGGGD